MKNRIVCLILVAIVLFVTSSTIAFACDENQTATYLGQLLFGNNAARWSSDDNMIMLVDALYLCSEQADTNGQDKLDYLKNHKVPGVPSLSSIDIKSYQLMDCSHMSWSHIAPDSEKSQTTRKAILMSTVDTVFGTDLIDNTVGSLFGSVKKTKYESFSALLYYSHILFDYLADDPEDTSVFINGDYIDPYSGSASIIINGDEPHFTETEKNGADFSPQFSKLDGKRTGAAFAKVGKETLAPPDSRKNISWISPSGWSQTKEGYEDVISDSGHLYERCHLIAHMLLGNDTPDNLITGTQYLNSAMGAYELQTAAYIRETENHVLYRATPIYNGDNMVASGVQLEAWSIEDNGDFKFNVYLYNVQPGIDIDYSNGENSLSDTTVGTVRILPFAQYDADNEDPDLIFEISKHLEILFSDQAESMAYKSMKTEIETVAMEARESGYYTDRQAKTYVAGKSIQYKYFQVLKAYVPLLLAKENFFASVFS